MDMISLLVVVVHGLALSSYIRTRLPLALRTASSILQYASPQLVYLHVLAVHCSF